MWQVPMLMLGDSRDGVTQSAGHIIPTFSITFAPLGQTSPASQLPLLSPSSPEYQESNHLVFNKHVTDNTVCCIPVL